jgi:hypothetical protein
MPVAAVRVEGIRELQRSLRQANASFPAELRKANKSAAEVVVAFALPKAPVKTGRLRKSIKAQAQQRGASVKGGTEVRVPYFGFIDFGGRVGIHGSVQREFIPEGRILYPALRQARPVFMRTYERDVKSLLVKAGLLVT